MLDQADRHSSKVELGVRMARLLRIAAAKGLIGPRAADFVVRAELDIGQNVAAMSTIDYEAFVVLFTERLEEETS